LKKKGIRDKDLSLRNIQSAVGGVKTRADEKDTTAQITTVEANSDAGSAKFYTLDPLEWNATGKQQYRKLLWEGVDRNSERAKETIQQKIDDIDDVMNFEQKSNMFKEQARQRAQSGGIQQATKVLSLVNNKVKAIDSSTSKLQTTLKDKIKAESITPEETAAINLAIERNNTAKKHFEQTGREINTNLAGGNYSAKSTFDESAVGEDVAALDKSAIIDMLTGGVEGSGTQILDAGGVFSLGSNEAIATKAAEELTKVIGQGVDVSVSGETFTVTANGEEVGTFTKGDIKSDGTLKTFNITDTPQASVVTETAISGGGGTGGRGATQTTVTESPEAEIKVSEPLNGKYIVGEVYKREDGTLVEVTEVNANGAPLKFKKR